MFHEEGNFVALFIDWDNLAISAAADLGGASPDVEAIVKSAQRFGTVLVARAYAEWQVPSDRMAVYRAGVDPIFAPTFRFEPDIANYPVRGKSLADPCLVADCIDTLHLMPTVSHFVLVSGDKDLLPIVRMVQLRGKRVVVIGPDYVAAVLREMADDYISYRSLVEVPEAVPAPDTQQGRRRRAPVVPRTPAAPVVHPRTRPPAPTHHGRTMPEPESVQPPRYIAPEPPAPPPPPARVEPVAAVEPPAPPPPPSRSVVQATPEESEALLRTIQAILKDREGHGKPRLRATNLKDLLLARIPGFNEKTYGYSRFKDLLAALEAAGSVEITRRGDIQLVGLPAAPAEPAATGQPRQFDQPSNVVPFEAPPAQMPVEEAGENDDHLPEDLRGLSLVRYIAELGTRSRWLTYTYVLTNLISHLSQRVPGQAVEHEARAALNRLVNAGILRVDKEPREIEVAGARHRVRMCHLEESHPQVREVLALINAEPAVEATATVAPNGNDESTSVAESTVEAGPFGAAPEGAAEAESSVGTATEPETATSGTEATETPAPAVQPELPAPAPAPAPRPPILPWLADLIRPVERPTPAAQPEVAPVQEPEPAPAASEPEAAQAPTSAPETEEPRDESSSASGESADADQRPQVSLETVYSALRDVLAEATRDRPNARAAAVKTRLEKRLGGFSERDFGFRRFKEFLRAAEKAGVVKVEEAPGTTLVRLPVENTGE